MARRRVVEDSDEDDDISSPNRTPATLGLWPINEPETDVITESNVKSTDSTDSALFQQIYNEHAAPRLSSSTYDDSSLCCPDVYKMRAEKDSNSSLTANEGPLPQEEKQATPRDSMAKPAKYAPGRRRAESLNRVTDLTQITTPTTSQNGQDLLIGSDQWAVPSSDDSNVSSSRVRSRNARRESRRKVGAKSLKRSKTMEESMKGSFNELYGPDDENPVMYCTSTSRNFPEIGGVTSSTTQHSVRPSQPDAHNHKHNSVLWQTGIVTDSSAALPDIQISRSTTDGVVMCECSQNVNQKEIPPMEQSNGKSFVDTLGIAVEISQRLSDNEKLQYDSLVLDTSSNPASLPPIQITSQSDVGLLDESSTQPFTITPTDFQILNNHQPNAGQATSSYEREIVSKQALKRARSDLGSSLHSSVAKEDGSSQSCMKRLKRNQTMDTEFRKHLEESMDELAFGNEMRCARYPVSDAICHDKEKRDRGHGDDVPILVDELCGSNDTTSRSSASTKSSNARPERKLPRESSLSTSPTILLPDKPIFRQDASPLTSTSTPGNEAGQQLSDGMIDISKQHQGLIKPKRPRGRPPKVNKADPMRSCDEVAKSVTKASPSSTLNAQREETVADACDQSANLDLATRETLVKKVLDEERHVEASLNLGFDAVPKTPTKATNTAKVTGQHSPIPKSKVSYRIGLSKRSRIAPLLKIIKK